MIIYLGAHVQTSNFDTKMYRIANQFYQFNQSFEWKLYFCVIEVMLSEPLLRPIQLPNCNVDDILLTKSLLVLCAT